MNEFDDKHIAEALPPVPLDPPAARRIRVRLGVEVEARRAQLLEGALYGGFALAAVAWALFVVVAR
jgi:hypothetical protein